MAHIGCPLIGDGVYGGTRAAKALDRALESLDLDPSPVLQRQALHAASLAFTHPATDERLRFETDWPSDMDYLSRGLALLSPRMGRP
jgi:23S rRNA pseudouridine1911/1915/1917 synthase